jgi:hypothetical protein
MIAAARPSHRAGWVAPFFADPVGWALGVKPQGPCNGTVFGDQI